MTETKATKRNTDYSASAVNLSNKLELETDLTALASLTQQFKEVEDKIETCIPQNLKDLRSSYQIQIAGCQATIRGNIETCGSYQDLDKGWYAVKQRKVSKNYKAEPFEKNYPQFASAVIVKAVNTTALNGLIKGGLLDEARLEMDGVLVCTETFAYIIKV